MANNENNLPAAGNGRHYTWPWWVLGALVLGILLAVLWMSQEITRTRRIRDLNAPPPETNQASPHR
jgi:hypothetical protein